MNLRKLARRQMRCAASGSIGELWDAPWKIRNVEILARPWPKGLPVPRRYDRAELARVILSENLWLPRFSDSALKPLAQRIADAIDDQVLEQLSKEYA